MLRLRVLRSSTMGNEGISIIICSYLVHFQAQLRKNKKIRPEKMEISSSMINKFLIFPEMELSRIIFLALYDILFQEIKLLELGK